MLDASEMIRVSNGKNFKHFDCRAQSFLSLSTMLARIHDDAFSSLAADDVDVEHLDKDSMLPMYLADIFFQLAWADAKKGKSDELVWKEIIHFQERFSTWKEWAHVREGMALPSSASDPPYLEHPQRAAIELKDRKGKQHNVKDVDSVIKRGIVPDLNPGKEDVDLKNCKFTSWESSGISQLRAMKKLNLQNNKMTVLDLGYFSGTSLEVLHLENNQIVTVKCASIPSLKELYLSGNAISDLSELIGGLSFLRSNLRVLHLIGNPFLREYLAQPDLYGMLTEYRLPIVGTSLPSLEDLDGIPVNEGERRLGRWWASSRTVGDCQQMTQFLLFPDPFIVTDVTRPVSYATSINGYSLPLLLCGNVQLLLRTIHLVADSSVVEGIVMSLLNVFLALNRKSDAIQNWILTELDKGHIVEVVEDILQHVLSSIETFGPSSDPKSIAFPKTTLYWLHLLADPGQTFSLHHNGSSHRLVRRLASQPSLMKKFAQFLHHLFSERFVSDVDGPDITRRAFHLLCLLISGCEKEEQLLDLDGLEFSSIASIVETVQKLASTTKTTLIGHLQFVILLNESMKKWVEAESEPKAVQFLHTCLMNTDPSVRLLATGACMNLIRLAPDFSARMLDQFKLDASSWTTIVKGAPISEKKDGDASEKKPEEERIHPLSILFLSVLLEKSDYEYFKQGDSSALLSLIVRVLKHSDYPHVCNKETLERLADDSNTKMITKSLADVDLEKIGESFVERFGTSIHRWLAEKTDVLQMLGHESAKTILQEILRQVETKSLSKETAIEVLNHLSSTLFADVSFGDDVSWFQGRLVCSSLSGNMTYLKMHEDPSFARPLILTCMAKEGDLAGASLKLLFDVVSLCSCADSVLPSSTLMACIRQEVDKQGFVDFLETTLSEMKMSSTDERDGFLLLVARLFSIFNYQDIALQKDISDRLGTWISVLHALVAASTLTTVRLKLVHFALDGMLAIIETTAMDCDETVLACIVSVLSLVRREVIPVELPRGMVCADMDTPSDILGGVLSVIESLSKKMDEGMFRKRILQTDFRLLLEVFGLKGDRTLTALVNILCRDKDTMMELVERVTLATLPHLFRAVSVQAKEYVATQLFEFLSASFVAVVKKDELVLSDIEKPSQFFTDLGPLLRNGDNDLLKAFSLLPSVHPKNLKTMATHAGYWIGVVLSLIKRNFEDEEWKRAIIDSLNMMSLFFKNDEVATETALAFRTNNGFEVFSVILGTETVEDMLLLSLILQCMTLLIKCDAKALRSIFNEKCHIKARNLILCVDDVISGDREAVTRVMLPCMTFLIESSRFERCARDVMDDVTAEKLNGFFARLEEIPKEFMIIPCLAMELWESCVQHGHEFQAKFLALNLPQYLLVVLSESELDASNTEELRMFLTVLRLVGKLSAHPSIYAVLHEGDIMALLFQKKTQFQNESGPASQVVTCIREVIGVNPQALGVFMESGGVEEILISIRSGVQGAWEVLISVIMAIVRAPPDEVVTTVGDLLEIGVMDDILACFPRSDLEEDERVVEVSPSRPLESYSEGSIAAFNLVMSVVDGVRYFGKQIVDEADNYMRMGSAVEKEEDKLIRFSQLFWHFIRVFSRRLQLQRRSKKESVFPHEIGFEIVKVLSGLLSLIQVDCGELLASKKLVGQVLGILSETYKCPDLSSVVYELESEKPHQLILHLLAERTIREDIVLFTEAINLLQLMTDSSGSSAATDLRLKPPLDILKDAFDHPELSSVACYLMSVVLEDGVSCMSGNEDLLDHILGLISRQTPDFSSSLWSVLHRLLQGELELRDIVAAKISEKDIFSVVSSSEHHHDAKVHALSVLIDMGRSNTELLQEIVKSYCDDIASVFENVTSEEMEDLLFALVHLLGENRLLSYFHTHLPVMLSQALSHLTKVDQSASRLSVRSRAVIFILEYVKDHEDAIDRGANWPMVHVSDMISSSDDPVCESGLRIASSLGELVSMKRSISPLVVPVSRVLLRVHRVVDASLLPTYVVEMCSTTLGVLRKLFAIVDLETVMNKEVTDPLVEFVCRGNNEQNIVNMFEMLKMTIPRLREDCMQIPIFSMLAKVGTHVFPETVVHAALSATAVFLQTLVDNLPKLHDEAVAKLVREACPVDSILSWCNPAKNTSETIQLSSACFNQYCRILTTLKMGIPEPNTLHKMTEFGAEFDATAFATFNETLNMLIEVEPVSVFEFCLPLLDGLEGRLSQQIQLLITLRNAVCSNAECRTTFVDSGGLKRTLGILKSLGPDSDDYMELTKIFFSLIIPLTASDASFVRVFDMEKTLFQEFGLIHFCLKMLETDAVIESAQVLEQIGERLIGNPSLAGLKAEIDDEFVQKMISVLEQDEAENTNASLVVRAFSRYFQLTPLPAHLISSDLVNKLVSTITTSRSVVSARMTYILESIARLLSSDGQVLTSERILSDQFLSFMFDQLKNAKLDDARLYRMLILIRDSAKLSAATSLKPAMRKSLLNHAAAFLTRVNHVKDLDILVANRLLPTILDLMQVLFEVDPIANVASARQLLLAVRNVFVKLVNHAKDAEKSLRSANHCLQALLRSCEAHKSEIRAPTIVQALCSLLDVGSEDVLSDTCQSLLELIAFSESHFSDFLRNSGMELIKPLLASRGILVRVRAAQLFSEILQKSTQETTDDMLRSQVSSMLELLREESLDHGMLDGTIHCLRNMAKSDIQTVSQHMQVEKAFLHVSSFAFDSTMTPAIRQVAYELIAIFVRTDMFKEDIVIGKIFAKVMNGFLSIIVEGETRNWDSPQCVPIWLETCSDALCSLLQDADNQESFRTEGKTDQLMAYVEDLRERPQDHVVVVLRSALQVLHASTADNRLCAETVCERGGIRLGMQLLEHSQAMIRGQACLLLSALSEAGEDFEESKTILNRLSSFISDRDPDVQRSAILAVAYFSRGQDSKGILTPEMIEKLITLLSSCGETAAATISGVLHHALEDEKSRGLPVPSTWNRALATKMFDGRILEKVSLILSRFPRNRPMLESLSHLVSVLRSAREADVASFVRTSQNAPNFVHLLRSRDESALLRICPLFVSLSNTSGSEIESIVKTSSLVRVASSALLKSDSLEVRSMCISIISRWIERSWARDDFLEGGGSEAIVHILMQADLIEDPVMSQAVLIASVVGDSKTFHEVVHVHEKALPAILLIAQSGKDPIQLYALTLIRKLCEENVANQTEFMERQALSALSSFLGSGHDDTIRHATLLAMMSVGFVSDGITTPSIMHYLEEVNSSSGVDGSAVAGSLQTPLTPSGRPSEASGPRGIFARAVGAASMESLKKDILSGMKEILEEDSTVKQKMLDLEKELRKKGQQVVELEKKILALEAQDSVTKKKLESVEHEKEVALEKVEESKQECAERIKESKGEYEALKKQFEEAHAKDVEKLEDIQFMMKAILEKSSHSK
eukprot:TRINITY_DN1918_c0_g1_i1.p1 TRINITY_DN1918_c0_g1~~TRINITY_DN1918_c0_g1_i1.p1  ORF type:complete len:3415 (-),score=999.51 TRINITY_DN1918_c0_g1_i1:188-10432(-)